MSIPAYPEYKESGVPWLGQIPTHWEPVRFKNLLRERDQRSVDGSEELLSVSAYTGVRPKSESTADGEFASRAESLEGYKVCKQGDLVMNIMLAWNRGLGVTQFDGIVSPAYCVFNLGNGLHAPFFDYAARADEYTGYYKAHSSGVIDSRLRLYPDKFGALQFAKPRLEEQQAIATFLDRETAKIDALVAEQERLIALLKEKRQAVISHAVTKGLDPDAPMKDSGIEWLGEIPAHWETGRLGQLTTKIGSGKTPSGGAEIYVDEGVLFLRSQNIYDEGIELREIVRIPKAIDEEMRSTRVSAGDILLNITGASLGRTCLFDGLDEPANVNQHVCIIRLASFDRLKFVAMALKSSRTKAQIDSSQNGAAREGLNFAQIARLTIALPPTDEATSIVAEIHEQTEALDRLANDAKTAIDLLQERRAALISAAVTGKIDVRGLVEQHEMEAA